MLFAHLVAHDPATGGSILVPRNDVDATGLLRARTLLAFLDAHDLLQRVDHGDWTVFAPSTPTTADSVKFNDELDDTVAKVPYWRRSEIRNQPGIALVRNTFEATTLFRNVYLRSSLDFLRQRPAIEQDLRARFMATV